MYIRDRLSGPPASSVKDLLNIGSTALAPVQKKLKDVELALTISTAASTAAALGVILLLIRGRR